jgi:hypothetical protein
MSSMHTFLTLFPLADEWTPLFSFFFFLGAARKAIGADAVAEGASALAHRGRPRRSWRLAVHRSGKAAPAVEAGRASLGEGRAALKAGPHPPWWPTCQAEGAHGSHGPCTIAAQ